VNSVWATWLFGRYARFGVGCSDEDGELGSLNAGVAARNVVVSSSYLACSWEKSRRVKLLGFPSIFSLNRLPRVVEPVHFYRRKSPMLDETPKCIVR
jgi:hypothetical protein